MIITHRLCYEPWEAVCAMCAGPGLTAPAVQSIPSTYACEYRDCMNLHQPGHETFLVTLKHMFLKEEMCSVINII